MPLQLAKPKNRFLTIGVGNAQKRAGAQTGHRVQRRGVVVAAAKAQPSPKVGRSREHFVGSWRARALAQGHLVDSAASDDNKRASERGVHAAKRKRSLVRCAPSTSPLSLMVRLPGCRKCTARSTASKIESALTPQIPAATPPPPAGYARAVPSSPAGCCDLCVAPTAVAAVCLPFPFCCLANSSLGKQSSATSSATIMVFSMQTRHERFSPRTKPKNRTRS